jgi:endoglucanase
MFKRLLLAVLVGAVVATGCTSSKSSAPPDSQGPAPTRPGGRAGSGAGGAEMSLTYDEASAGAVTAAVRAPAGATEMQIGVDPTFAAPAWQPVAQQVRVPVADTGYVMVFARFRSGSNATPTGAVAAGVDVDPTWAAATASAAGGPLRASSAGLVAPDVLAIRIETGRVVYGAQEQYSFGAPPAGDVVSDGDEGRKVVTRGGAVYGTQVAAGADVLKRPDVVLGRPLDAKELDKAAGYRVTSAADSAYSSGRAPSKVTRVTRPIGLAKTADGDQLPVEHQVFLALGSPLRPDAEYSITFPDGAVEPLTFTFGPHTTRSLAVHVNELGFRPSDITKVAYLSTYDGATAFTYAEGTPFDVVDAATGTTVFSGKSHKRTAPAGGEAGKGDLTGAETHELDFSALSVAGRYRVCVPTIGCSYDFALSDLDTWQRAAVSVARSVYHQRSGTALEEPYTAAIRPRGFSPDDGVTAVQSSVTLMASSNGLAQDGDVFADLAKADTGATVDGAWGGHFDAGDWDRRIQHLWYLREAIQLVELHPDQFAHLELGIPESGNAIPDLIDEGLWDLDLYKRLQQPDGGVRGGIEAADHPLEGQTSWTQTQKLYVYAADPWSSYIYAGVAAEAARVLAAYDVTRADAYRQSALAAMTWADSQTNVPEDYRNDVSAQRAVAAAALYRLTGETRWQDVFLANTPFADGSIELLSCDAHQLCDAGLIYAQTNLPTIRADVKANVVDSFRRNADRLVAFQDSTLFGWTQEHPQIPLIFGLGPGAPKVEGLLRAYLLTNDRRYCSAALRSASFSMGGNPLDTVFMTGVGQENVRYPLIVDNISGGMPAWPGTPIFGPHDYKREGGETWIAQYFLRPNGTKPDPAAAPFLREWFDLPNVAPMTEFTVYQSHAPSLFAYGNLAALRC